MTLSAGSNEGVTPVFTFINIALAASSIVLSTIALYRIRKGI